MFGRKPPSGSDESPQTSAPQVSDSAVAPTPFQPAAQRPAPPVPPRPFSADPAAGLPARPSPVAAAAPVASVAPPRRPAEPVRQETARDVRKLIVGRDITLSGEIVACDHLIIEGTVEASVKECHRLEVAEAGLFRGTVDINEAEIAGRFEGQITVHGRLLVRSTGRIEGKIHYGELMVEAGGTLDGQIHVQGKAKNSKTAAAPTPTLPTETPPALNLTPAAEEAKA